MNKTRHLLLLGYFIIIAFLQFSSAQNLTYNWSTHIKRTTANASVLTQQLLEDSKGNNYLIGMYGSDISINDNLYPHPKPGNNLVSFIGKFNPEGTLLWIKNEHIGTRYIQATIDSADIFHVFVEDTLHQRAFRYERYDTDWNQLSVDTVISYNPNVGAAIHRQSILLDKEDNKYFVFRANGYGHINIMGTTDSIQLFANADSYLILKYNTNNEFLWWKRFNGGTITNYQTSVNANNNLIISGTFKDYVAVEKDTVFGDMGNVNDFFCLQFDNSGNLKWIRGFGLRAADDYCNDLIVHNNHIYLAGTLHHGLYKFDEFEKEVLIYDPYILQLNQEGKVVNVQTVPINSTFSAGRKLVVNDKNQLFLAGQYRGVQVVLGKDTLPSTLYSRNNMFIAAFDQTNLKIRTAKGIESNNTARPRQFLFKENNQFLLAGHFNDTLSIGDEIFTSDFNVGNRYEGFLTSFQLDLSNNDTLDTEDIVCNHPDYAPLVALYEATDGGNWTTSWDLSDCDVCSYSGITCNENGRVARIDLDGNNLNGFIPSEIGEFSNLVSLNLAGNTLSGSIPSSIGKLTTLTGLTLSANQLSGNIPSEIGNLTELSSLWLDNNSLFGNIPNSLGNLRKIIFLTLRGNNLTGNIPGSLGNLNKGEFLLLEDNNLSGNFPKELSSFGNQREINPNARGGINVANNNLSGCYPIEFKAFCRTDFGLIVDGNENLSDFSEFCFFEDGACDTTEISCDNLQFTSENNQITLSGLTIESKVEIIGRNTDYNVIGICDGDCSPSKIITDLASGDYTVKVNLFDGNNYCYREEVVTIEGNMTTNGTANCDNLSFRSESNQIIVEGLTATYNKVELIGQNTDWQVIPICDGDCSPTLVIPDLESGEYAVKVNQSGDDGSYCYREKSVMVSEENTNTSADCDNLNFLAADGQITIEGLMASYDKVEIIGRNTDWQVVSICDGDCDDTQVISDLAAGEYSVKVNQGGTDGSFCYREEQVILENGSSSRNGALEFEDNLVLYPNPARDRVNITLPNTDFQKGAIHIYNVFGQQVLTTSIDELNQEVLSIDLDGFENGIYVITIQLEGLPSFSRRLVVEHLR